MRALAFNLVLLVSAVASAAQPAVLAHSSGDTEWIAWIGLAPAGHNGANAALLTRLYARRIGPGEDWRQLATVPGRAIMLAGYSSQLAVLMADGEWRTVWTEAATGQSLPADGRMRALADDGPSLWAVGIVDGGRAAALAATRPATAPATHAVSTPVTRVMTTRPAPRPVLFHEIGGRWSTVAEFPPDATVSADAEISLVVQGDTPVVAFRAADGAIRVIRLQGGKWDDVRWDDVRWDDVHPPGQAGGAGGVFKLVDTDRGPMLWRSDRINGGDLWTSSGLGGKPTKLDWDGHARAENGPPTIAFAGGRLRAYTTDGKQVFEQPIGADGKPLGAATAVEFPVDPADSAVPTWIEAAFLASMTFSIGAVAVRQYGPARRPATVVLLPAPASTRLAAGMVDLIPLVVPLMMFSSAVGEHSMPKNPAHWWWFIAGGFAVYLLHTTVVETVTGRSIGKRLFGLKVIDTGGGPASTGQLLARNLLRTADPLVLAIVSPLGQRTGDVAAGTMVVVDRSADRRE